MKNLASLVIAFVALALGAYAVTHTTPTPAESFGASGQTHSQVENFLGDLTVAGNIVASSTSASVTLKGTEFVNASTLDYTVNVANKVLTLPASTTPLCSSLARNERRAIFIRHASTTAANTLTIAGGTGFILKNAATSTGPVLYGNTDGSPMAQLVIMRKANSDCNALMTVFN
jgi:hypothetical protein